jgi:type VI secretion system protein ImpG
VSGLFGYYQDELAHLRDLGREFARAHPDAASHLGGDGTDPDVERLLEGFAFLTARVRQKLDDDLPEITHALLDWLWPGFLRPIPSMTIVQFTPMAQARECVPVRRGSVLESTPIDGTRCRFRTAYDTDATPLVLASVALSAEGGGCVALRFEVPQGASARQLVSDRLRLHLSGVGASARWLRRCLLASARAVTVATDAGGDPATLPGEAIQRVGFARDQALLPDPPRTLPALRLLQEYLSFPDKFLFVDLVGLDRLPELARARSFTVRVHLDRIPAGATTLTDSDIALNCTPAINLFACDADPIRLDHRQEEYRVRVAGIDPAHSEVFSVDRVAGTARATGGSRVYAPLYRGHGEREAAGYQLRRRPSIDGGGTDCSIAVSADPTGAETLSLELTCTNRGLPANLAAGALCRPGTGAPAAVRFANRLRPTASLPPPLTGDTHWLLLSHLACSIEPLLDAGALSRLIALYDRRPGGPRDHGIVAASGVRATRVVEGLPIRGVAIELTLREARAGGADEQHLLVSILEELFSQYVSINSYSQLTVRDAAGAVRDRRPARLGTKALL